MDFSWMIVLLSIGSAKCICNIETVTKIKSLFGSISPAGVTNDLVGTMTYLYIPQVFQAYKPGLKCIKTVLDEYKIAEDYYVFPYDAKVSDKYHMKETESNITRIFTTDLDGASDDYVIPVFLRHGVFGFWQCRHDYDPFINIGVMNYMMRKDDEEVKGAIEAAKVQLDQLGVDYSASANC